MSDWRDADVLCPFYQRSDSVKVKCEGLSQDNKINLVFKNSDRRKLHMQKHCCADYRQCQIYKMLIEKYVTKLQGG